MQNGIQNHTTKAAVYARFSVVDAAIPIIGKGMGLKKAMTTRDYAQNKAEKLNRRYAFFAVKYQSISLKIAMKESRGLVVTRIEYGKKRIYAERMADALNESEKLNTQFSM